MKVGTLTFGDATFDQIILDTYKLHVAIKITEELLYDNAFQLENYVQPTKTNAGTRRLPITEDVAECFRAILEDREQPAVERIVDGYSGFLFLDKEGLPLVAMLGEHRFNHMVARYNEISVSSSPTSRPMSVATPTAATWRGRE